MRSRMAILRKIAEQGLDPKQVYVSSKEGNLVPKFQKHQVAEEKVDQKTFEEIKVVEVNKVEEISVEIPAIVESIESSVDPVESEEKLLSADKPKKNPFKKKFQKDLDQKI